jgi:hypothetical protein
MLPNRPHPGFRTIRLAALALAASALVGCQSIAGIQPVSQVRVIDASPDAPALDIHQNSAAALYNIGFGTISSYVSVNSGPSTHVAYTAGTQQQLSQVRATLVPGNQYTVLAGNVVANLQMTVLKDQSIPAPAGQVALRFLDQTTRVGALDIYLLPPGEAPIVASPLIAGATFASNTGYINAPAGTYSIVAYPAGTVPLSTASPAYTGSQLYYPAGSARTVILIDQPAVPASTPSLQILVADDFDPSI